MGDGVSKPIKPHGVEDSLFSKVTESKEREASTPTAAAQAAPDVVTPSAVARQQNADAVFKSFQEQVSAASERGEGIDMAQYWDIFLSPF